MVINTIQYYEYSVAGVLLSSEAGTSFPISQFLRRSFVSKAEILEERGHVTMAYSWVEGLVSSEV
jgi:hypothetical protein